MFVHKVKLKSVGKLVASRLLFCSSSALNRILNPENLNSVNRCAKLSFDVFSTIWVGDVFLILGSPTQ